MKLIATLDDNQQAEGSLFWDEGDTQGQKGLTLKYVSIITI